MLMRLAMMMASVGCKLLLDKSTDVAVFSSPIGSSALFSLSLVRGALAARNEQKKAVSEWVWASGGGADCMSGALPGQLCR